MVGPSKKECCCIASTILSASFLVLRSDPGSGSALDRYCNLLDGLCYLVRSGCRWRYLPPPPAFPPWRTVYRYTRAFLQDGVWESIRHRLVVMLRESAGREASPMAAIVDTQSVKTTESGGPPYDFANGLSVERRPPLNGPLSTWHVPSDWF
ncbi:transposase [Paracraurococcus lichenis]|uniref:transposase n=1 Tax=Paracraurococcus lichenis TaxID=3064888 RepID=UPI00351D9DDD